MEKAKDMVQLVVVNLLEADHIKEETILTVSEPLELGHMALLIIMLQDQAVVAGMEEDLATLFY